MRATRLSRPLFTLLVPLLVAGALSAMGASPSVAAVPMPAPSPTPVTVNGRTYDAYLAAATKEGQFASYTCEFDAAWVVLKTFGYDVGLDEQITIVGHDEIVEPYIVETSDGFMIYGGGIADAFSGDYTSNFLARTTAEAMRPLFERFELDVQSVASRAEVEAALRGGALIWMKATVDFLPWQPATWVAPDGRTFSTVLGNDHAVVVMGYNAEGVVIRDVLGPTSTNWERPYEYEVDWETFLVVAEAQDFNALAVSRPRATE